MRESERTTTWTCDMALSCGNTEILTGGYQDVPPGGWRIIHVLPAHLNLALEGDVKAIRRLALCTQCFAAFIAQTGNP